VKPISRLGLVVGKEIELSWEVVNKSTQNFTGGILKVVMESPDGHFVILPSSIPTLKPNVPVIIDKDVQGNIIITHVHAQGFTLFRASVASTSNVVLQSPSGNIISPELSFFSFFGKTKEEISSLWALAVAVIGLVGTFIVSALQLLHDFGII
jgi:hypothetical protein